MSDDEQLLRLRAWGHHVDVRCRTWAARQHEQNILNILTQWPAGSEAQRLWGNEPESRKEASRHGLARLEDAEKCGSDETQTGSAWALVKAPVSLHCGANCAVLLSAHRVGPDGELPIARQVMTCSTSGSQYGCRSILNERRKCSVFLFTYATLQRHGTPDKLTCIAVLLQQLSYTQAQGAVQGVKI